MDNTFIHQVFDIPEGSVKHDWNIKLGVRCWDSDKLPFIKKGARLGTGEIEQGVGRQELGSLSARKPKGQRPRYLGKETFLQVSFIG